MLYLIKNALWGAGHIQGEMMMLGYFLSEGTVAKLYTEYIGN